MHMLNPQKVVYIYHDNFEQSQLHLENDTEISGRCSLMDTAHFWEISVWSVSALQNMTTSMTGEPVVHFKKYFLMILIMMHGIKNEKIFNKNLI